MIEVAAGVVFRDGRVLITQRRKDDHLGGVLEISAENASRPNPTRTAYGANSGRNSALRLKLAKSLLPSPTRIPTRPFTWNFPLRVAASRTPRPGLRRLCLGGLRGAGRLRVSGRRPAIAREAAEFARTVVKGDRANRGEAACNLVGFSWISLDSVEKMTITAKDHRSGQMRDNAVKGLRGKHLRMWNEAVQCGTMRSS